MTLIFSRRMLLGMAAAGGVYGLAGCTACPPSLSGSPGGYQVTAAASLMPVTDVPLEPGGPYDISNLLSTPSFYVAHRGSGDNWPEHTMRAYRESVAMGLKALEVSVSATGDGVLVCHHDLNTFRMTGRDLLISAAPYAELKTLRNDARAWLGPAVEPEPIPRLDEVLDAFGASHVIFLEDKQGANFGAIMSMLRDYPQSRDHIVWKQPAASSGHALARRNGYITWGYVGSSQLHQASAYMDRVDLLGVPALAPDDKIREFVDTGKPVIGWEVHRRSERDRLLDLDVRGMMCSNLRYVLQRESRASVDGFDSGERAAGDLPWDSDSDWGEQPMFTESAIRLASKTTSAYTLGSMGPVADAAWKIAFELRWPDSIPGPPHGAGVMFGAEDDAAWRPGLRLRRGGYLLDALPDGRLILHSLDKNSSALRLLAETKGDRMTAGQWQRFEVSLLPEGVTAKRLGASKEWSVRTPDSTFRGGYFSVTKNYDGGPSVDFRNLEVSPLTPPQVCNS